MLLSDVTEGSCADHRARTHRKMIDGVNFIIDGRTLWLVQYFVCTFPAAGNTLKRLHRNQRIFYPLSSYPAGSDTCGDSFACQVSARARQHHQRVAGRTVWIQPAPLSRHCTAAYRWYRCSGSKVRIRSPSEVWAPCPKVCAPLLACSVHALNRFLLLPYAD